MHPDQPRGWKQTFRPRFFFLAPALLVLLVLAEPLAAALSPAQDVPGMQGEDADAALVEAMHSPTWPRLRELYEKYGDQDDGYVAEGFDNTLCALLSRLTAQDLRQLAPLPRRDPGFFQFVLRHAGCETVPAERQRQALERVASACDQQYAQVCRPLLRALRQGVARP